MESPTKNLKIVIVVKNGMVSTILVSPAIQAMLGYIPSVEVLDLDANDESSIRAEKHLALLQDEMLEIY